MVYSHTGYEIIICFRPEVIAKNVENTLRAEFLENSVSTDYEI